MVRHALVSKGWTTRKELARVLDSKGPFCVEISWGDKHGWEILINGVHVFLRGIQLRKFFAALCCQNHRIAKLDLIYRLMGGACSNLAVIEDIVKHCKSRLLKQPDWPAGLNIRACNHAYLFKCGEVIIHDFCWPRDLDGFRLGDYVKIVP